MEGARCKTWWYWIKAARERVSKENIKGDNKLPATTMEKADVQYVVSEEFEPEQPKPPSDTGKVDCTLPEMLKSKSENA